MRPSVMPRWSTAKQLRKRSEVHGWRDSRLSAIRHQILQRISTAVENSVVCWGCHPAMRNVSSLSSGAYVWRAPALTEHID